MSAAARAAHLLVDHEPFIFTDPLAARILGDRAPELLAYHHRMGSHPILSGARTQAAVRSRYTEHRLAEAVGRDVTQYVILGAGLDSFAYRNELGVRVFEIDHPDTQEWKRHQLESAGITLPENMTLAGVDFVKENLVLTEHGLDPAQPSFVSWLGVSMYLSREDIARTLASLPPGTELVADYMLPAELRDTAGDTYAEGLATAAAERGEPWLSFFTPAEISCLLAESGFTVISDVNQHDAIPATLWNRTDSLDPHVLSRLIHARRLTST